MTVATYPVTTLYAAKSGLSPLTADDLWALPRVGAPAPGPDGTWSVVPARAVISRRTPAALAVVVPADGAEPRPLKAPSFRARSPRCRPPGSSSRSAAGRQWQASASRDAARRRRSPQAHRVAARGLNPRWLPDARARVRSSDRERLPHAPGDHRHELERREKDPLKARQPGSFFRFWDQGSPPAKCRPVHLRRHHRGDPRPHAIRRCGSTGWRWPAVRHRARQPRDRLRRPVSGTMRIRSCLGDLHRTHSGGAATCLTPDHPASDHQPQLYAGTAGNYLRHAARPFFYADRVRIMRYTGARERTPSCSQAGTVPAAWEIADDGTVFSSPRIAAASRCSPAAQVRSPPILVKGGTVAGLAIAGPRLFFSPRPSRPAKPMPVRATTRSSPTYRFTDEVMSRVSPANVREMHYEACGRDRADVIVLRPAIARRTAPLGAGDPRRNARLSGACSTCAGTRRPSRRPATWRRW